MALAYDSQYFFRCQVYRFFPPCRLWFYFFFLIHNQYRKYRSRRSYQYEPTSIIDVHWVTIIVITFALVNLWRFQLTPSSPLLIIISKVFLIEGRGYVTFFFPLHKGEELKIYRVCVDQWILRIAWMERPVIRHIRTTGRALRAGANSLRKASNKREKTHQRRVE